ncbi:MAG: hypothetical protein GX806_00525, partial [Lentisphaerae bacterium]|nr:hypothetical protein [Lentisphaerota bacterium]
RTIQRNFLMLCLAGLLLTMPGIWLKAQWSQALFRILNPFSMRAHSTLAILESVHPGDSTIRLGEPLLLTCQASGQKGQEVFLELWPADDKKSLQRIGELSGGPGDQFSFQLTKVTTALQYRFRAGDALSARHQINVLAPLAIDELMLTITPPAYTRLAARSFNGLLDSVALLPGSLMMVTLRCNRELQSAELQMANTAPFPMLAQDKGSAWRGQLMMLTEQPIMVQAKDQHALQAQLAIKYRLEPDQPPRVRILAPQAPLRLAAGAAPQILFEVSDDFGIAELRLEQIGSGTQTNILRQAWQPDNARQVATNWTAAGAQFNMQEPLVLQLIAIDNCNVGQPNRVQSDPIIFHWTSAQEIQSQLQQNVQQAAQSLSHLVELQRANLETTTLLARDLAAAQPAQWQAAATVQATIMQLAGQLISNPQKPLGALSEAVRTLYSGAMREAIETLERIPLSEPAYQLSLAQRAVLLEQRILRILMRTDEGYAKIELHRATSGLLALLDAIFKDQTATLESTKAMLTAAVGSSSEALVQKQDRLASDMSLFTQTCRTEAQKQSATDKEFSQLLMQVAAIADNKKVMANMLRAAEQLQAQAPRKALPWQEEALEALRELHKLMHAWRVGDAAENTAAFQATLQAATQKIDKLAAINAQALEAIRAAKWQADQDHKKTETIAEELDEELKAIDENTRDVLLQIATDLHIFPELPVGNDLVEDVYQVFEECQQVGGSDTTPVHEEGLQKDDWILEFNAKLQDTKKRMEELEGWLFAKPDNIKRTTESFDLQEMPKQAVIPMPAEIEDVIGDLLQQQEVLEKTQAYSASNQSVNDLGTGGDTFDGEMGDYSAKGKSANLTPQHREQDGRSIVGRQGMSAGETTAGSGKINAGDEDIAERATQDPSQSGHIQEEEHSQAKATGGGKLSGYSDDFSQSTLGSRRDSQIKEGSELGLQAMLRQQAQAIYAQAQLAHIRTGSLDEAIRHMQQAENAIQQGTSIQQVREFQRLAILALKKTQTELGTETMIVMESGLLPPVVAEDQLAGTRDEAPVNYRQLVSEYFKQLSATP